MSNNTILLTGQAREDYIKAHFTPDMVIPDSLEIETEELLESVSPEFKKAREDFANWYDGKDEDQQEFIDEISDRTYSIIDEEDYDEFIELLDDEGINDADDFTDRFEAEFEYESELIQWVEELVEASGYLNDVPAFIANHIDYQSVWQCELRYDYSIIEFNNHLFLFRQG